MIPYELLTIVLQNSVLSQWLVEFGLAIEHAFAPIRSVLKPFLSSPITAGVWALLVLTSLGVFWWDLRKRNQALPSMMKFVWTVTVIYSGSIGLAIYWWSSGPRSITIRSGGGGRARRVTATRAVA